MQILPGVLNKMLKYQNLASKTGKTVNVFNWNFFITSYKTSDYDIKENPVDTLVDNEPMNLIPLYKLKGLKGFKSRMKKPNQKQGGARMVSYFTPEGIKIDI